MPGSKLALPLITRFVPDQAHRPLGALASSCVKRDQEWHPPKTAAMFVPNAHLQVFSVKLLLKLIRYMDMTLLNPKFYY